MTAVREWLRPGTVKELQKFLGFANFYRSFIRNYSSVAAPLTSMLKGSPKKIKWNISANQAFDMLKGTFTMAPTLQHPNPEEPFVVEVDASNIGVGAVLSQRSGEKMKLHPVVEY